MIIKALVENTTVSEKYACQHGLSLYIETPKHKLLLDMGADGLFAENAKKLEVDLTKVDTVVLSHGHWDHGGGLETFLSLNNHAEIYVQKHAFEKYYALRPDGRYDNIGINASLAGNAQIKAIEGWHKLDEEITVFSGVSGRKLCSNANKALRKADYSEDGFAHEENLVITAEGKTVLLSGCSHNGIINILEYFEAHEHRTPDVVIAGMHLYNPTSGAPEPPALVQAIAKELLLRNTQYYTCHCTGLEAYEQLREQMGTKIKYLATGAVVKL